MPSDTYTLTISDIGVSTPSTGSVVNASVAANAAIAFSKLATLTSGNILVGNSSNVPTSVAVTGDVTISNTGVTSLRTSPTLVTPILGTPTSGTLTSCTGLPLTTGVTGILPVGNGGTGVTTSTGSGANALATSPSLTTPILGTPTSGTLTNCTGLPISTGVSGLGAGVATFLTTPSSANLDALVTDDTGSGVLVFSNNPTLVSPVIGVASGTSLTVSGALTSSGTAGIGYVAGAGGIVTQGSSKTNPVTLNKTCGQITMDNEALAQFAVATFTLNNSTIADDDVLILNHVSGGTAGKYLLNAQCAAGSASINVTNVTTGSASEAIVIAFVVIKASVIEV